MDVRSETPSEDEARWRAVQARDAAADGVFVYAVRTTGVYCRPSCAARPKRANVEFFAGPAEALAAGYRACKRCGGEPGAADLAERIAALPWDELCARIDAEGYATTGPLLREAECAGLRALFAEDARFRSRIDMARHGFGKGQYRYFAEPLPPLVAALRRHAYTPLARLANAWQERLGRAADYPASHAAYRAACHAAGQLRPTPLLLRYRPGDYNRMHQDLYGEMVFPLQLAVLLSEPGRDFTGGEFLLAEQRPRMQTRTEVVPLAQGEAVIFAVAARPVTGTRGAYRATMRHGVSLLRSGERYTLGVIFHDAR